MTVKAELALPTAGIACADSAENWAARFAETANDDETAMSPLTSKTRRCDTLTPSNILFTPLTARVGWRTTVAGLRLIRHYPKSASIACLISSSATTAQDRADSSRNPWPKLAGRHKTQTGQRIHAERVSFRVGSRLDILSRKNRPIPSFVIARRYAFLQTKKKSSDPVMHITQAPRHRIRGPNVRSIVEDSPGVELSGTL